MALLSRGRRGLDRGREEPAVVHPLVAAGRLASSFSAFFSAFLLGRFGSWAGIAAGRSPRPPGSARVRASRNDHRGDPAIPGFRLIEATSSVIGVGGGDRPARGPIRAGRASAIRRVGGAGASGSVDGPPDRSGDVRRRSSGERGGRPQDPNVRQALGRALSEADGRPRSRGGVGERSGRSPWPGTGLRV